jgi:anti-sigma factor RsiW
MPTDNDRTAEAYPIERLPPEERQIFESHVAECPRCAECVEANEVFRSAIRAAAERLDARFEPTGRAFSEWPTIQPKAAI